jgi:hypothetical protein
MKSSTGFQPAAAEDDLVKIAHEEHLKNADLAAIHLRDARNILYSIPDLRDNRALSKSAILLAAAALESNLTYLAGTALRFTEARPRKFDKPHIDFLRGVEREIDDNGRIVEKRKNQTLVERMQIVPGLLARAVDREYELPRRSASSKKMQRTIARRDAIVHPKWDRYMAAVGWWEAAEAVDAVELYLYSVQQCLHPYVNGYSFMLWTIKGPREDDMGIGHRTFGKRGPNRKISTMGELGIVEVLLAEWCDSMFMTQIALGHECEKDSKGSMLTRAALVLLYAMLDAHLAVVSQWKMRENPSSFSDAEILFLNEAAVGIGHDGEVWIDSDQHSFKKRVKAIPVVLARCIDRKEFVVDLGKSQTQELLNGHALRSKVMHSSAGEHMPRVSKEELRSSVRAVHAYFEELANSVPGAFGHMLTLLEDTTRT